MSRRGKNNVMRSIVQDASSIFSTEQPAARTPTNNFNPLFHYLQTMFPNYDNAVLNSVLEQEGNSIERAVEVLLTFAVPEEPKINNEKEPAEITFDDDNFSDTETLSNVFAVPVMPPVTSHNSGRDHVSLYEQTRKKRKPTKSQRARRRQRAQAAAAAAAAAAAKSKKVKWVPLQEFIVESSNPFEALPLESEPEPEPEPESEPLLLSPNLVEQPELLDAFAGDDEQNDVQVSKVLTEEELKWDDFDTSDSCSSDSSSDSDWHPEEPWVEEEPANKCDSDSDSCCDSDWVNEDEPVVEEPVASSPSEDEGFVVIEEPQALPTPEEALPATIPVVEDEMSQQVVVVKLYYSASDIHRLGLTRSTLTFAKLYDYAAAYLQSKAEQSKKADLPLAFALTYVDDENDVIHLCSEEELAEALRLHDDVFWTDGKQPLLRVHIKSLGVAASNDGHIIV